MDAVSNPAQHNAKQIGNDAERLALSYLQSRNFELVKKNFHCRYGEIDLIMLTNNCLVFIEVRYRKHKSYGNAAESVDYHKQQKILKTAEFFLQRHINYNRYPYRFDIVYVEPTKQNLNWIPNAFDAQA